MRAFLKAWSGVASAVAVIAALASCGDEGGAATIGAAEFCDAYVDTMCGGLEPCCDRGFSVEVCGIARRDECEQNILTLDDRGIAPTGPNAPARIVFEFDERGAGEALARLKGQLSQCSPQPLEQTMFEATHVLGEPGAECLRNEDCMEGTRCEQPPRAVFGTCVVAPLPGELCTDVCAYREDVCVIDPLDGRGLPVCVAPRAEGQSCDVVGCERGLVCSSSGARFEPTCVRGGQPGDACSSDYECVSGFCDGSACAASTARHLCAGGGIAF